MKPNILFSLLLLLPVSIRAADLQEARQFLKQNQPDKAAVEIRQLRAQQPGDSWLVYDAGVAAYASKDYEQADKIWQELAALELPNKLRDQVWNQIGNVSYRLGEQAPSSAPEDALPRWESSREAYRIVLASRP